MARDRDASRPRNCASRRPAPRHSCGVMTQPRAGLGAPTTPPRYRGGMGRTDSASRVIGASAERLYAAFTDPVALAEWLPPQGMTGAFEWFDPVPGGGYRMRLTYEAEGAGKTTSDSDVVSARFVELQ